MTPAELGLPDNLETETFWYLATPYSKHPDGIDAAFRGAALAAAALVRLGAPVYSPIAHSHPVATYGGLDPLDHDIWLPAMLPFMRAASGLIICTMAGWETSYGVKFETNVFRMAGKPVLHMRAPKDAADA